MPLFATYAGKGHYKILMIFGTQYSTRKITDGEAKNITANGRMFVQNVRRG